jgi:hypothetical protein
MEITTFDPVTIGAYVAGLLALVQFLKSGMEKLETWDSAPSWVRDFCAWWAHGYGPMILAQAIALLAVVLPPIIQDGVLTFPELKQILTAIGLGGMSNIAYIVTRWKFPRKLIFGKSND